jgi:hypothetical protein
MTKRYELTVANIGRIGDYETKEEAIKDARSYVNGEFGGRGMGEPAYVYDTETEEIVFEVEPHDVPA